MRLTLNTTLKQTVTPQMIQSMEILQLSAVELSEYLEKESLENPLIDIDDTHEANVSKKELDFERKLEWLSTTDHQNKVYYSDERNEDKETNVSGSASEETLKQFLISQIKSDDFAYKELCILGYIIYCLDNRGYLRETAQEISEVLGCHEKEAEDGISVIKSLDPAGVGAKDLSECLLIQLIRNGYSNPIIEKIIKDYLPDVGKKHYKIIAGKMGISEDEVISACEIIKKLNPTPASGFADRNNLHYISPDAVIVKEEEEFTILINEYSYPKIEINSYYKSLLEETDDKDTIRYIRERIQKVEQIQNALLNRRTTLARILNVIVENQLEFFVKGPGNKRPLGLKNIADATDLHESTVSRALSGKYLQCTWGVFPLNFFLENSVPGGDFKDEMSRDKTFVEIRKIIDNEDKSKPLCDEAIAKALVDKGVHISRRTVNKYRGIMGIPDKSARKELS